MKNIHLCAFAKSRFRTESDTLSLADSSAVSLLAGGERSTPLGALRTIHVHCQLYDTCSAGRCHHPEEKQCAYRGRHGPQGQMRTRIDPSCLPQ
ncbi:hypothetical protein TNCV_4556401 [Trichonephila clavipes]|nr:hypothetical protein TNCV_4556401 [Trichonephila clavipes]